MFDLARRALFEGAMVCSFGGVAVGKELGFLGSGGMGFCGESEVGPVAFRLGGVFFCKIF